MNLKFHLFLIFNFLPFVAFSQTIIGLKDQDFVNSVRKQATVRIAILDKNLDEVSVGAGFYIGKTGMLLTNFHVLRDFLLHPEYKIQIKKSDGSLVKRLSLLNCNQTNQQDLCLLNTKANKNYFPISNTKIGTGHLLTLIGHCGEGSFSIKKGKVIEYYKKDVNRFNLSSNELNYKTELIQTSAKQCPGDSGGPFFSGQGELLGIASIVFKKNSSKKQYNIGITNNEILKFIKQKRLLKAIDQKRIIKSSKSEAKLLKFLD